MNRHSFHFALTITLILSLNLSIATTHAKEQLSFTISGWSEVVQSVSDLKEHRRFMQDIAGWQVISEGPVDSTLLAAWQLPVNVTAEAVLMGNPGTDRGFIRFVQFHNTTQVQIRSGARPWEAGGIFDINVRVLDMDDKFLQMQQAGWSGHSDPVHYQFDKFEVKEWIGIGTDGLSFALIERIKPVLKGWPQIRQFSRAFNSTQIVADMPAAMHFYQNVLGFKTYLEHRGASEHTGPNVLGLADEWVTTVEREVLILHPLGTNEGSVELLKFHGLSGRDLSARAVPPNLGMLMLRFPVDSVDALEQHFLNQDVKTEGSAILAKTEHWGARRQISARSPDGVWMDFYESTRH